MTASTAEWRFAEAWRSASRQHVQQVTEAVADGSMTRAAARKEAAKFIAKWWAEACVQGMNPGALEAAMNSMPFHGVPPPRCGDHVLHRPTGETWFVAWCDGRRLAPAGWPASLADLADCEVTYRCTDEEHRQAVDEWRRGEGTHRKAVLRLYGRDDDE